MTAPQPQPRTLTVVQGKLDEKRFKKIQKSSSQKTNMAVCSLCYQNNNLCHIILANSICGVCGEFCKIINIKSCGNSTWTLIPKKTSKKKKETNDPNLKIVKKRKQTPEQFEEMCKDLYDKVIVSAQVMVDLCKKCYQDGYICTDFNKTDSKYTCRGCQRLTKLESCCSDRKWLSTAPQPYRTRVEEVKPPSTPKVPKVNPTNKNKQFDKPSTPSTKNPHPNNPETPQTPLNLTNRLMDLLVDITSIRMLTAEAELIKSLLGNALTSLGGSSPPESPEVTLKTQSFECNICFDNEIQVLFEPCGHVCVCEECSRLPAIKNCPQCRSNIESKKRVYLG